jgi:anti-sigma28 factor (negative regulator of flagellin synthesis)
MKVNGISNTKVFINEQVAQKKSQNNSAIEIKDKIEISKAAKERFQEVSKSKIERIKANIANKVYDSDEVLNKVAENILKEFNQ